MCSRRRNMFSWLGTLFCSPCRHQTFNFSAKSTTEFGIGKSRRDAYLDAIYVKMVKVIGWKSLSERAAVECLGCNFVY